MLNRGLHFYSSYELGATERSMPIARMELPSGGSLSLLSGCVGSTRVL